MGMADMKSLLLAVALIASSASVSAFAQTLTPAQVASDDPVAPGGEWVPPYGQPTMQTTRAQVYQELGHAEQDGQLAYLNSTIYARP
jgi:uncharacterized protein DUF4148